MERRMSILFQQDQANNKIKDALEKIQQLTNDELKHYLTDHSMGKIILFKIDFATSLKYVFLKDDFLIYCNNKSDVEIGNIEGIIYYPFSFLKLIKGTKIDNQNLAEKNATEKKKNYPTAGSHGDKLDSPSIILSTYIQTIQLIFNSDHEAFKTWGDYLQKKCVKENFYGNFMINSLIWQNPLSSYLEASQLDTKEKFIVKKINKPLLDDCDELKHLVSEIVLNNQIDHQGIAKILQIYESHTSISIIYNMNSMVNLASLNYMDRPMTEETILKIIENVLKTLAHLKQQNIFHTRLTPQCIFVNKEISHFNNNANQIKIINLCSVVHPSSDIKGKMNVFGYLAPEFFMSTEIISEKIDVFALGVIAWELLTNENFIEIYELNEYFKQMETYKNVYKKNLKMLDKKAKTFSVIKNMISEASDRHGIAEILKLFEHLSSPTPMRPMARLATLAPNPLSKGRQNKNPTLDINYSSPIKLQLEHKDSNSSICDVDDDVDAENIENKLSKYHQYPEFQAQKNKINFKFGLNQPGSSRFNQLIEEN